MTGFDSKRKIAQDRLDDDDIQVYAQPVQEPVAWAVYDKRGGSKSLHWPENHSPNGDATKFDAVPLYATPPKRPWVDLSDSQIEQVYYDVAKLHRGAAMPWGQVQFGRALQALIKELNK
jgi:hypothetical protein